MTNIIPQAIEYAIELHEGQTRKDQITPYIVHPLTVGFIMARFSNINTLIVAAILHDVVEDTSGTLADIKEKFGEDVAYYVDLLTEDKSIADWSERKRLAIEKVSQDPTALVLKAADNLSNMQDLKANLETYGISVWEQFNVSKDLKLQYYKTILDRALPHLPSEMLAEYVGVFKDIEYFNHS